jgi:hypothetical protein
MTQRAAAAGPRQCVRLAGRQPSLHYEKCEVRNIDRDEKRPARVTIPDGPPTN